MIDRVTAQYCSVQPFENMSTSFGYFGCHTQRALSFGIWLKLLLLSVDDVM